MTRAFDHAKLFDTTLFRARGATAPYRTDAEELDAVASGAKGMSMFSSDRGWIATSQFGDFAGEILGRDLLLVLDPAPNDPGRQPEAQPVRILVMRRDQVWRVPAFSAFWGTAFESGDGWNMSSEALEGLLLGYTTEQRATWRNQRRWHRPSRGFSVYTLLSARQRAALTPLGRRCLGTPAQIRKMTFFVHRDGHEMRRTAARLAPKGTTIARAGISLDAYLGLIDRRGASAPTVMTAKASAKVARTLNDELLSDVELLVGRAWT